ncbi:GumC family protein [Cylindrospermum sp. FACHB-282]|uniref:GumC family protein n=1 Tax=Cylindrospermum sp. FACHB-282 TaxID=2692794 RepID=UPI0018F0545C|nr:polysaccharide biosynthesis tyrosine autokinase [Cylindrospermum sp. FACHB-282]
MIENNSFQSSSSPQNKNFVHPYLPSQPLPWDEAQGNGTRLPEILGVVRRRWLLITGVTTTVMVTVLLGWMFSQRNPEYEGSFQLLVESVNNDSKEVDIVNDPNSGKSNLDYQSQIQVLKSPELMENILKNLQILYPNITYNSLLRNLSITRLGETKIIEVRYRSKDPDRIKVVLDRISQDYLKYSLEKRQTRLRQGIRFVEKQLPFIQNRVDQIQKELQIFRQKYKFNDPENQIAQITTAFGNLSQQRQIINSQLVDNKENLALLQGQNGTLAALNNATVYQQLIAYQRQLDIQIAMESTRLQEDNPSMQVLKEKRETILSLLNQESQRYLGIKVAELVTKIQILEVQSQELAKTENQLEQQRKQLPILARQYSEIQRKLQVANESLNRFLSTRENLQIQISQTELDWQILQAPYKPDKPISSANLINILIPGLSASILLGIGVALLKERTDNTYHSVHILKENIRLPLLGSIPFEKRLQNRNLASQKTQKSLAETSNSLPDDVPSLPGLTEQDFSKYSGEFLESLRILHTNIQLLGNERQIRSIIISSAMPGDGKSTVAFHLAQIATEMGKKVLLVDADLRQPKIHTLSNLNNLWGLSNLISTNLPVEEAIRQLPSMSQLSVLTAGPIPLDPTKLLSSDKIKGLIADFQNNFDLVIYDAPPLMGLADASLLAPLTDGMLILVRIEKTDTSVLKRALDNLKISRMNILGMVSNGQKYNSSYY